MRDILFRGKKIVTGEWVYGYYVNRRETIDDYDRHFIYTGDDDFYEEVDFNTVGQYVEKNDKNYTQEPQIFEGDVFEDGKKQRGVVFYSNDMCGFYINWHMQDGSFSTEPIEYSKIGNKFDNPELLKVTP